LDGIHDLGGRHGFGGSLESRDDETFHAAWEGRVHALTSLLMGLGCFNVDAFRHSIERLSPVAYLDQGYYGRWLGAVEQLVAEVGGHPIAGTVTAGPAKREVAKAPMFRVGDRVTTRNLHRAGHTRLPSYARARCGEVVLYQGAWVLPDTHAHGRGECPDHVYAVRFEGSELWGDAAEPGTSVSVDLFESYLEPV
jgi:hypothetical protein